MPPVLHTAKLCFLRSQITPLNKLFKVCNEQERWLIIEGLDAEKLEFRILPTFVFGEEYADKKTTGLLLVNICATGSCSSSAIKLASFLRAQQTALHILQVEPLHSLIMYWKRVRACVCESECSGLSHLPSA